MMVKHQSYSTSDGTGKPFKTAYILQFGLTHLIKRDAIFRVKGPFVLIFDESLNQTSKTKQLPACKLLGRCAGTVYAPGIPVYEKHYLPRLTEAC